MKDAEKEPVKYVDPMGAYSADAVSEITIAWEQGSGKEIFERNLERIITQKWIAIFPLGLEAWAEHRRTGYPRLLPAVERTKILITVWISLSVPAACLIRQTNTTPTLPI